MQRSNSSLPKKDPQLGNPSTRPIHPEGSGYTAVSPWSSESALVPSPRPHRQYQVAPRLEYLMEVHPETISAKKHGKHYALSTKQVTVGGRKRHLSC